MAALGSSWPGARQLTVDVPGRGRLPALAYPPLVGDPHPGDRVVLSTEALELGLGTGGQALVVWIEGRRGEPAAPTARQVKARYTPGQVLVAGVEEADSPHRSALEAADDLGGMPVVVAELHSGLPAVLVGLRAAAGEPVPVAYVMTDGGALPLWFSRTVAHLSAAGWLAGTVTVGQSFGGELEAVSLHSGLLAARAVLGARVTVVAPGPGTAGTGSRWGFSGVAAGEAVNAVAVLGGRPVASLRLSSADPRQRHRGLSHHSVTAYGRVALAGADVVVPHGTGVGADEVAERIGARHRVVVVPTAGLRAALAACPAPLSHMGRGPGEDPDYFLAAAAAGVHAARLLTSRR